MEWLAGYHDCEDYGFVALRNISKGDESAAKVFEKIDYNGGGTILLDEWCNFMKDAEIKAGTALGATLAEDEEGGIGKVWVAPTAVPLRVKAPKGFKASTDDVKARAAAVAERNQQQSKAVKASADAKAALAKKLKADELVALEAQKAERLQKKLAGAEKWQKDQAKAKDDKLAAKKVRLSALACVSKRVGRPWFEICRAFAVCSRRSKTTRTRIGCKNLQSSARVQERPTKRNKPRWGSKPK